MLHPSIASATLIATVAVLVGCADTAAERALPGTQDAGEVADGQAASPTETPASLTAADLTDGCEVLTEERARTMLGADVTRRRGGACVWVSRSGMVRLLFSPIPLAQFDISRDDHGSLASTLRAIAQLDETPTFAGEVAGGLAFTTTKDDVSVFFAAPGVRTTAMLSDRPVGEVLIQLSLRSPRPHAERLASLEELAVDAANSLRELASGGGADAAAAPPSELRPAPGSAPATEAPSDAPPSASAPETDSQGPLGSPRDDLQRFYGVYGAAGERRNFFVAEARAAPGDDPVPSGHLMVGATWGDVQPWHMTSLSDTRFEQAYVGQFQDAPLVVEFHTDGDGSAVALTFKGMFDDRGRLERIGDLPEGR